MAKKIITKVFPAGNDQPEKGKNDKEYTNFGVLMKNEGESDDSAVPERVSLYGNKVDFVKELSEKGAPIEVEVVDKDTFFNTRDNQNVIGGEFFGKWNLKFPYVAGQGGGRSGGGGWKGGGGRSWGGGGGGNGYKGKPMKQSDYAVFCATVYAESVEAVKAAVPDVSNDKLAEVAQALTATKLIGMQHGMSYPVGHEPAQAQSSSGGGSSSDTPSVDTEKPIIKDYIIQIGDCSTQQRCTIMTKMINEDSDLSEDERVFLRSKTLEQQKAIA